MRIVVTTCPRPVTLSTPKTDSGATGWMTITPYRMRSQSVSERRSRGDEDAPEEAAAVAVELMPFEFVGAGESDLRAIADSKDRDGRAEARCKIRKTICRK